MKTEGSGEKSQVAAQFFNFHRRVWEANVGAIGAIFPKPASPPTSPGFIQL
jgi:hypothetical protein